MTTFVLVIVAAVVAVICWISFELLPGVRIWRRPAAAVLVVVITAAVIADLFAGSVTGKAHTMLAAFSFVVAVCGGAVVSTAVFAHIDAGAKGHEMAAAGQVLRGGAWIGALERVAVFATLVAGWPQGVAVVLAVKALGRYPELRNPSDPTDPAGTRSPETMALRPRQPAVHSAAAERFIIGTLVSFLWAAACSYLASGW